jgi:cytochrome c peroxidase
MGQSLSGSGFYGRNIDVVKTPGQENPLPVNRDSEREAKREKPPQFGASTREWRTPSLWGLRDSAPYLHDGRAVTIEDAINQHDGAAALAARAFEKLTPAERTQLDMFLKSLAAPGSK